MLANTKQMCSFINVNKPTIATAKTAAAHLNLYNFTWVCTSKTIVNQWAILVDRIPSLALTVSPVSVSAISTW